MQKIYTFIVFCSLAMFSTVHATELNNLKVTVDDRSLYISWTPAENEIASLTDGYALQWSSYESDMRHDKHARQYLTQTNINLRSGGFEKEQYYYFRVYTYKKEGRRRYLANGSKILKWKWQQNGEIISEEINANDTVSANTSSTTSTVDTSEAIDENFGNLRTQHYDNFADFFWSRPKKLTSSDYNGFHIVVSTENDLNSPVAVVETTRSNYSVRVKGLKPSTNYYAKGFFYKFVAGESKRFGEGELKQFKTISLIDRDGKSRASRNIKKIEKKALLTHKVGSINPTSSSAKNKDTASNVNSSIFSTSSSASTVTEIKKNIELLRKEIKRLESELKAWQKKLREKSSPSRSSKYNRSSDRKKSVRERLRERLKRIKASKR